MGEEVDKKFIQVELVEEALPYLVKGHSTLINKTVIGFPYVYMEKNEQDVNFVNCIITPNYKGHNLDIGGYAIAFENGEFHPVNGKMYKFVRMSEDGIALFEDDIMEDEQ